MWGLLLSAHGKHPLGSLRITWLERTRQGKARTIECFVIISETWGRTLQLENWILEIIKSLIYKGPAADKSPRCVALLWHAVLWGQKEREADMPGPLLCNEGALCNGVGRLWEQPFPVDPVVRLLSGIAWLWYHLSTPHPQRPVSPNTALVPQIQRLKPGGGPQVILRCEMSLLSRQKSRDIGMIQERISSDNLNKDCWPASAKTENLSTIMYVHNVSWDWKTSLVYKSCQILGMHTHILFLQTCFSSSSPFLRNWGHHSPSLPARGKSLTPSTQSLSKFCWLLLTEASDKPKPLLFILLFKADIPASSSFQSPLTHPLY